MKPAPFEYLSPNSLEEALDIKAKHGDSAKPLAGGQSLIPAMNFRVAQPEILIDLNKLGDLDYIREDNGEVFIGAMARQSTVEKSSLVKDSAPLIHETMPNIAHPQIRNRGTFGGSLAHADPASELPVIALALDARFKTKSAKGKRWIMAKDFFLGYFEIALQPDELLVEIAFPNFSKNTGWSFMEIARRKGDYTMAGVAALIALAKDGVCKDARLVYLNVGDGPVEAIEAVEILKGNKISTRTIESAASYASESEMEPIGNMHATPEYQRHLSPILTIRAVEQAHSRAKSRMDGDDY